jgi:hypothetical protein
MESPTKKDLIKQYLRFKIKSYDQGHSECFPRYREYAENNEPMTNDEYTIFENALKTKSSVTSINPNLKEYLTEVSKIMFVSGDLYNISELPDEIIDNFLVVSGDHLPFILFQLDTGHIYTEYVTGNRSIHYPDGRIEKPKGERKVHFEKIYDDLWSLFEPSYPFNHVITDLYFYNELIKMHHINLIMKIKCPIYIDEYSIRLYIHFSEKIVDLLEIYFPGSCGKYYQIDNTYVMKKFKLEFEMNRKFVNYTILDHDPDDDQ